MRVVPCMLLMLLLCTTSTGCSLFKKNTNSTGPDGGAAPAKFPGAKPDPLVPNPPPPPPTFPPAAKNATSGDAILAGTIKDGNLYPIGNAYIRLVNLDDANPGAPIDVASDSSGHFIFQGLKPGASYKLIARTMQGDKMLAGTVLTNAPNPHIVIAIRADLANASTPPLPGSPAVQKQEKAEGASSNGPSTWNTTTPTPKGQVKDLPANITVPTAPTNTPVGNPAPAASGDPSFPPGIAELPKQSLPLLAMPTVPRPDTLRPAPVTPNDMKLDTGPTRVPSCLLLGNHLENLALKDSKGQTWEYKKQAAGKVLLIDFWSTHCMPCRDMMPILNRLHKEYGPRGLEVIGIALEPAKDERREAEAVNKLCGSMQVNYRQLMGHTGSLDLAKEFKIRVVPTLMLVTDTGDILQTHEGAMDAAAVRQLEGVIQRRLR